MHITPNRIQFPFSKINNDVQHFLFRTIIVSPVVQFPSAVPLLPLPLIEFSLQSAGCLSPTFSPFPPRFFCFAVRHSRFQCCAPRDGLWKTVMWPWSQDWELISGKLQT